MCKIKTQLEPHEHWSKYPIDDSSMIIIIDVSTYLKLLSSKMQHKILIKGREQELKPKKSWNRLKLQQMEPETWLRSIELWQAFTALI